MTTEDGLVSELWRYPVKSMLGEALASVAVDARGVVGDRRFAVCDAEGKLGSGKNTRRMRRMDGLFAFTASRGDDSAPRVTTPDGRVLAALDPVLDEELARVLGIAVRIQAEDRISHFDDSPIHLVTRASLQWLETQLPGSKADARRFRANLVVDAAGGPRAEETWRGRTIAIGTEVVLRVTSLTERCVMTTMAQADLPDDPAILGTVARESDRCFGVYAEVLVPGRIARGDRVRVERSS